jgi:SAM-dependent methyltransferase
MGQIVFDEEMARQIEALYRIRDAAIRRGLVREKLAAQPGEHILDVGCGPGFYCLELAEEVGEQGTVVGIDSSQPMLTLAERRCEGFPRSASSRVTRSRCRSKMRASTPPSASRCSSTYPTRRQPCARSSARSSLAVGR